MSIGYAESLKPLIVKIVILQFVRAAMYKKGCRADVSNYRPVNLRSVVCKLMESILRDNIMEHFTANISSSVVSNLVSLRVVQRHYSYYRFWTYGQSVWNREGRLM